MTNETTNTKRPSHRLYQVVGEGKSSVWTPVASAWEHSDGCGYNILVPFIGKIVMREITAKDDADQGRLV